ncbi:hypothetical protein P4G59_15040 [Lactiplantibacillus plantarum]|uniref:hypothetical protein n=1 Tax=Lactiplantibacillus plantarum TaxID=1590 RepID=UPI0021AA545D|nr:hypothetical protein [Lactiplantibacillus plantarum]MDP4437732.1 hypothetical protein [Lactiplantibacillus plantarum]MDP4440849.1 hypothetical protein [Lactiplantibacillus plantarum]MDP4459446.1 hypothetical protein [Lactiplantibacillus plantarum]
MTPEQNIKAVFSFETLSSTEWNYSTSFRPNYFVDISKQLQSKLDTMGEYKSELRKFPHPRSLKAIENNALTWGAKSGMLAAEPFVLLRGKDLF